MTGRPSDFTEELAANILSRLSAGETLTRICADEGMPARQTVNRWRRENEAFRSAYAQARIEGMEAMADEVLDIADDGTNDYVERTDPGNAGYDLNGEHVQRSRLRVDTRKFLMAKIAPSIFGESLAITGKDGGPIQTEDVGAKEIARRMAFALAAGLSDDSGEPA